MADFVFTAAVGRVGELYNRVDLADPTNAGLIIDILATSGLEADATLRDLATFAALVAGTTNFVGQANVRKTLAGADLAAIDPDEANDRLDLDIPDQTWTAVAAGDGWSRLVTGYDPDTTGGADSAIVPMTGHTFVVTPDGSDIVAQIAAAGFYRATAS